MLKVPELAAQYRATRSEETRSHDQVGQAQDDVRQTRALHASCRPVLNGFRLPTAATRPGSGKAAR